MGGSGALMPVLLDSESIGGQGSMLLDVRPGKYKAFGISFTGTSDTGQTPTDATFGRFRLTERGRDLVNIDAINLRRFDTHYYDGNLSQVYATAGACRTIWQIPRGWRDTNVQQVIETDQIQFAANFDATFTTVFPAAAQAELYGFLRDTGEMAYNLRMIQLDKALAASATEPQPIRDENILAVYLVHPSAAPTRIRIMRDGNEVTNVAYTASRAFSDLNNSTESLATANTEGVFGTTPSTITEYSFAEPGEIGEFLSDDLVFEVSTGSAATYSFVTLSADFTPSKLRSTMLEAKSVEQRRLARKVSLNRNRPTEVLQVLNAGS